MTGRRGTVSGAVTGTVTRTVAVMTGIVLTDFITDNAAQNGCANANGNGTFRRYGRITICIRGARGHGRKGQAYQGKQPEFLYVLVHSIMY